MVNYRNSQFGDRVQNFGTGMYVQLETAQAELVALAYQHGADAAFFRFRVVLCVADEMAGELAAYPGNLLVGLLERIRGNGKDADLVHSRFPVAGPGLF